jgi:hypothetical protein
MTAQGPWQTFDHMHLISTSGDKAQVADVYLWSSLPAKADVGICLGVVGKFRPFKGAVYTVIFVTLDAVICRCVNSI